MKQEFPFYKSYEKGKRISYSKKIEAGLCSSDKKIIADFCFHCSGSKTGKRSEKIKTAVIQFCDFLEKPLDKLQDKDFLFIEDAVKRCSRTIQGKNDIRIIARRFGTWFQEEKKVSFPSLKKLKMERVQGSSKIKDPKDLLTELELHNLLKATTNIMHKCLISLMWESAGRPEEILKCRFTDVDFKNKNIKLHSAKTGNFRVVPLDVSINHLTRLKEERENEDNDLIFQTKDKQQINNNSFNLILQTIAKKAGIKKHISGYTFRHTRLSQLIKTLSPKVYEMFSGHSLEQGMRTYAHLDIDDLTKEMKEKVFGIKELTPEENAELKKVKEKLAKLEKLYEKLAGDVAFNEEESGKGFGSISDVDMLPAEEENIQEIPASQNWSKFIKTKEK